jgi:hypothetical protein
MPFKGVKNFAQTTVATARTSGSGTLAVTDASVFDAATALPDRPVRLVITRSGELVTILLAASRTGNNLSVTAVEVADAACEVGDDVRMSPTAGTFDDIHSVLDTLVVGTDVQAYSTVLSSFAALTDPGADRILFWDDSASAFTYLTPGSGLSISGTTLLSTAIDQTSADARYARIANNLSDLTDATAARSNLGLVIGTNVQPYNASLTVLAGLADPNADRILFWDDSAGAFTFLSLGSNLSITGTSLNASITGGGGGDLLSTNNLSDLTDPDAAVTNLGLDPVIEDLQVLATTNSQSFLVSGGGVTWITGYQYRVSAAVYYINGTRYTSSEQTVTLDAADPTNNRFDLIILDITGTADSITGTAAPNPNVPDYDPQTQLSLSFVQVTANTTEPTTTSVNVTIYAENTEWTTSVSAGTINPDSTNNPKSGTKCIEGTTVAANTYVQLEAPSPIDLSTRNILSLAIRPKASFGNKTISVRFLNDGVAIGTAVTLAHGFSSSTLSYQQIVIPLSQFAVSSPVDQVRFTVLGGGSAIGFYLDDISLQATTTPVVIDSITQTEADARYLQRAQNLSDLASPTIARANLSTRETLRFALAVGVDAAADQTTVNYIRCRSAHTLIAAWANAATAPTGASLIVDIEKSTNNGSSWASLWAGNIANRPTIAAAANVSNDVTAFDSTTGSANTLYRAKVIQPGSTIAGSNITLELEISY